MTLSNGIYIDSLNLTPSIQNKIRRMAAFRNPKYYKNNAIGTSNYDTASWIYLGKDHLSGYIEIPRGLYGSLMECISESSIPYEIADERQPGKPIHVSFTGELRDEQKPALQEMLKYDNGILHAATAFGKTVVCSAMIAERKVNTLIVLESSALIEQWEESLNRFLDIDEELPKYKTKTGRIKTRKSLIGTLQGAHDSLTGLVDIAMAGSLCKKGEYHSLLNQYGMIIVDECHHAASDTISGVLREVKARYVYGVTATPISSPVYTTRIMTAKQTGAIIWHIKSEAELTCAPGKERNDMAAVNREYSLYSDSYEATLEKLRAGIAFHAFMQT